jgi:hypothetical protein
MATVSLLFHIHLQIRVCPRTRGRVTIEVDVVMRAMVVMSRSGLSARSSGCVGSRVGERDVAIAQE